MSAEILALISSYFLCSGAAEQRLLDRSEVEACTGIYIQVKLSFLPDIDLTDYQEMTVKERADTNRAGYAAYLAWRAANADLVQSMENDVRRQLAETDS